MQWQPIETLPSEFDRVLVARADGVIAIFAAPMLKIALAPSTPAHLRYAATHWMPLPAPPETKGEG